MKSPFEIFRKNQKVLMAVAAGGALVAFTLFSSINNIREIPTWMWAILFAALMGCTFWVIGTQFVDKRSLSGKSKQWEYALGGVVLGAAIAFAVMFYFRPTAAVSTNIGKLSEKELGDMVKDRQTAVDFMRRAYMASVDPPPEVSPMMMQFAQQNPQIARMLQPQIMQQRIWRTNLFFATFNHIPETPVTREEAVEKYLLLKEADKMGIRVNRTALRSFVDRVTNKNLSRTTYHRILKDVAVSDDELTAILKDELKAQIARGLLQPQGFRTPDQMWSQYRKLNVKQHIETAELPVANFIDQVDNPKDDELKEFFTNYQKNFRKPFPSPNPAFAVRSKARVAYFEADREAIEAIVLADLESGKYDLDKTEIQAELKTIREGVDDLEKRIADGTVKKEDVEKERADATRVYLRRLLDNALSSGADKIARLEFDTVKRYEDTKSTSHANPEWARDFPTQPGGADANPFPPSGFPGITPPKPSAPENGDENSKTTNGEASLNLDADNATFFTSTVALQPKTNAPAKPAVAKRPPTKFQATQPPQPFMPEDPPPKPFLPLDGLRKQQIRDEIIEERTQAEIDKRMAVAGAAMGKLASDYEESLDGGEFDPATANKQLESIAAANNLKYVETDYLTEIEFTEADAVPFATAQLTNAGRNASVVSRLYLTGRELTSPEATSELEKRLFRVLRTDQFVFWKTGHRNKRIPDLKRVFADPPDNDVGVKQQVEKSWKEFKARTLTEKQAKEYAKDVENAGLPIDRVLAAKTVTGKKTDSFIKTHSTKSPDLFGQNPRFATSGKFSWMINQMSSSAPNQPAQRIPLNWGTIPGLDSAELGEDFRRTIFEELGDGEVGVAYNIDKSKYYVVRVFDRTPGGPVGRTFHMGQFLKENPTSQGGDSIYGRIQTLPAGTLQGVTLLREHLWEKYGVEMFELKQEDNSASE